MQITEMNFLQIRISTTGYIGQRNLTFFFGSTNYNMWT